MRWGLKIKKVVLWGFSEKSNFQGGGHERERKNKTAKGGLDSLHI